VDADGFEFFLYSGFILILKDEVLMYMAQNAFLFRLFTEAACESQVASFHIFFSRLCITSGFPLAPCNFL
jgi:hypothetical protein